ncbi:MAG: hypothetical protein OEX02_08115 [Cyclobacteriaceae bacterium]|nr:hypothetical protein [Cyclobacteriaceae bacterium]
MGRKPEGKAENSLKHFGKKVDEMISDLKSLKEKATEQYSDQIEELKRNKETFKEEIDSIKESSKGKWTEIEGRLEKAGHELKEAFKTAFHKEKEGKN